MEIPLNAVEEEEAGTSAASPAPPTPPSPPPSSPPPPPFTIPARSPECSPAAISSLLTSSNTPRAEKEQNEEKGVKREPQDHENPSSEPIPTEGIVDKSVVKQEQEQMEEDIEEDDNEVGANLQLTDQELLALKKDFQSVLKKYFASSKENQVQIPAPKRHKKSKHHTKRSKPTATSGGLPGHSIEEILQQLDDCLMVLNQKIPVLIASSNSHEICQDIVRFCWIFLLRINQKDPVDKYFIMLSNDKKILQIDFEATITKIISRPLYTQLLSILRHTIIMLKISQEQVDDTILNQLFEWATSTATRSKQEQEHNTASSRGWLWLFVYFAQVNPYLIVDFLMKQAISSTMLSDTKVQSGFVELIEYLSEQYPFEMMEIVQQQMTKGGHHKIECLIQLALACSKWTHLCGDHLEFWLTEEVVCQLIKDDLKQTNDLSGLLLKLLQEKAHQELKPFVFPLLQLLDKLIQRPEIDPSVNNAIISFQHDVFRIISSSSSTTKGLLTQTVAPKLPYICTLVIYKNQMEPNEKDTASVTWKDWLRVLSAQVSSKEVLCGLVDLDLYNTEVSTDAMVPDPKAFYQLVMELVPSISSVGIVHVLEHLMKYQHASRKTRQRVIQLMKCFCLTNLTLEEGQQEQQPLASPVNHLFLKSSSPSALQVRKEFIRWKKTNGIVYWETFLEWTTTNSDDPQLTKEAFELIVQVPFESLENPIHQYRILSKLVQTFSALLKRFRWITVRKQTVCASTRNQLMEMSSQLEILKHTIHQIISHNGSVALYSASVYVMFVTIWMDFLFTMPSPTSIPTHFPSLFEEKDTKMTNTRTNIIRCERTISSKCTNLQASKVITHVADELIYRKPLDLLWDKEMEAAINCSLYGMDVLQRILDGNSEKELDLKERRIKTLVDMLLERLLPSCGLPSDDIYKDFLPNRSTYDVDLRTEQWLNHFPAFLPLLRLIVSTPLPGNSMQKLRLLSVFKSILVVCLGHWNSVKGGLELENVDVPPYMRNRNQLALTCELLQILRLTGWIPLPLANTAELLPLITPADIRSILFSCWRYLIDFPPTIATPSGTAVILGQAPPLSVTDFYLIPLRRALHRNIHKVGANYAKFMC